jgi:probable rRNA maturation factor
MSKSRIQRIAKILLSDLGFERAVLSILLTDDAEISRLNHTYRKKRGPTDVLSFAMCECEACPTGGKVNSHVLGDVVISLDTAMRQAEEQEETCAGELQRLLVHGVLHLSGYDHDGVSRRKAAAMRKKEAQINDKLKAMEYTFST